MWARLGGEYKLKAVGGIVYRILDGEHERGKVRAVGRGWARQPQAALRAIVLTLHIDRRLGLHSVSRECMQIENTLTG